MVLSKLRKREEKKKREEEDDRVKIRGFSPQEIFLLKTKIHAATKHLKAEDWIIQFQALDRNRKGVLSFDDFRKAVRRANVKTTVIGDDDLKDIATIVDEDGSGQIDVHEFLGFLRPDHIPDLIAKASSIEGDDDVTESLGRGRPGWNRSPAYTVNGVGLKMSDDGGLVHTGELDFNTWSSEKGLRGQDVWIQFALPRVYFLSAIQLWNYMSWERTREEDVKRSLKAFDVTYSLNGKHWFPLGRVEGLPAIPSTGIFKYYGECIQNKSAGGKDAMPFAHRKAALVEVDDWFGLPVKYVRFTNLENHGNVPQFGLNGVYLFGTEAEGDCDCSLKGLETVPENVYVHYQYVIKLNLSHNKLTDLPEEMSKMVCVEHLDLSHNRLTDIPEVLISTGDFKATITSLTLSHNLFTTLSPDIGKFFKLEVLNVAGHFWDIGGLPEELGNLKRLQRLDLSGIIHVNKWLWDDTARARHGLPPSSETDHAAITETDFLAYVRDHPRLLTTLELAGARAMFHRYDKKKKVAVKKHCVATLDLHEAAELDAMIMQMFGKPFCGLPEEVWSLAQLTDLVLERSGVDMYRYPGQLPKLPALGVAQMVRGMGELGVFTMLEEQARSFSGAIYVDVPNISSVLEVEATERILRDLNMYQPGHRHFTASAEERDQKTALKTDRRSHSELGNPHLPRILAPRYRSHTGAFEVCC